MTAFSVRGTSYAQVEVGDCLDVMKRWPAASADACIADPTYGDTSLAWDKVVHGWLAEAARVLKPAASLWVFGSMRSLAPLFAEVEALGFRYSQDIVWEKQNGTGFHNDRFRRVHEHAVMFYRGRWSEIYHDTQYTMDARAKVVRRKTRPAHTGFIEAGHYISEDGGPRLVRSVLRVRNEHGRAVHPTQKPEALIEPLLRYSVPLGGVVIDPMAGSGTVPAVALRTGRTCWAAEISPEYVAGIQERLDEL